MFVIVDHSSALAVNVIVKLRCCYEEVMDKWSTGLFLLNLKIGYISCQLIFDHHIIDVQSQHNHSSEPLQINYKLNKQVHNLRHVLF